MDNPRQLALKSLVKTDTGSVFSNLEINTTLERAKLSPSDRGLYTALYLGVLEKKMSLDYVIEQYSNIPLSEIDVETLNILRLGIYQLYYMDKIPDYSATNESVSLANKRTKGFINAIIRSFIRDGKKINFPKEKHQRVSIEYSYPMEIIDLFINSYGEDTAYGLITKSVNDKTVSLRVNTLKAKPQDIVSVLTLREDNPQLIGDIVKTNLPIKDIKDLIDNGLVFVQDEASRICSMVVDAKPSDTVLDACACPGGKTFSMSIDMENKGEVIACDLHASKLSLISKGAKKLGIDIISAKEQNGKAYNGEYCEKFDKVLCDVPCSGLGIVFKKPDIKYKSIDNINNLPSVQYEILSNCAKYVKKGGILVYSTCTLNKAENENNVLKFLNENRDFIPLDFEIRNAKSQNGMYTFMPHIDGTDGFFVARMKRQNEKN
ncbi:MAG: 16S rRNA (cytosine(967)-C(5))-methyltransferase RsmB [Clostridia bacterium]|nr:16S rRNA (cytosine(967)-C(5))-methyltransferase RsmB [Clostridia bacterium]